MMDYQVVIIGAGVSGLEQAQKLKAKGKENVLMIEFEDKAGGRPWDFASNETLLYETLFNTKVIDIEKNTHSHFTITCQNETGIFSINVNEIYLTTGAVERERFFDFIIGDRPAGDIVPKLGLNLLKRGYAPGYKPLIVNSNEYAQELVNTLKEYSEIEVKELNPENYEIIEVLGQARVENVVVKNLKNDKQEIIECDAFVYANGLMPMTHAVLDLGVDLDKNKYVITKEDGQSSLEGFYAFGDVASVQ